MEERREVLTNMNRKRESTCKLSNDTIKRRRVRSTKHCKRKYTRQLPNKKKAIGGRAEFLEHNTKSLPIKSYNSLVTLFESRSRLRKTPRTKAKISKYHILENGRPIQDICHKIINTNINLEDCDKNINLDSIVPIISPILKKFQIQHNKFKYLIELKNEIEKLAKKSIIKLTKKKKNKKISGEHEKLAQVNPILAKQKYKSQIPTRALKYFFGSILYKNVPFELFGTWKNFEIIKKTIYCLLKTQPKMVPITRKNINKTGFCGSVNIEPLLKKFDISKIKWLHPLKDTKTKWIVILKLLHWFFRQYIIKILHKYIVLMPMRQRWLYLTKDDWCHIQNNYINEKVDKGHFLIKQKDKSKPEYIKKYYLTASSSGLRIIARGSVEKMSGEIDIILRFLQQLYCTYFSTKGLPTVQACIKEIVTFKNTTTNYLYYVRCDIKDAFGSIIQEKLFDIIKLCCTKYIPLYLTMRKYKQIKKNLKKVKNKEMVQFLDLKKLRNVGELITEKPILVNWLKLTFKIKKMLFEKQIKLYGKIYLIKMGVPQGLRLSPIFSDIYYQDMFNTLFVEFQNNGCLCRYVDDILYVTENKNYAEEFLNIVRNGVAEYNVNFNPHKIQTNVELPQQKLTKVNYLGKHLALGPSKSCVHQNRTNFS